MPIQKVTSGIIADGAIVATDIADGTVTGPKLGANSVSSNNIIASVTLTTPRISGNLNLDTAGTTGIRVPAANTITFHTAGTEDMRIDANGNIGIGTSSPTDPAGFSRALDVNGSAGAALYTRTNGSATSWTAFGNYGVDGYINNRGAGSIQFFNNNAERMRIDSSGNFLVGTTSDISAGGTSVARSCFDSGSGQNGIKIKVNNDSYATIVTTGSATNHYAMYMINSSGSAVGSIFCSSTTTTYNTSSDYRLKENVAPMTGALARVQQLKPCTYTWKVDGSSGQGFIAHELQEVVPDAVTGEKDAVETYTDEEGNEQTRIKPQGVDTSFLVATLTAAIQELKTELDDAKQRITELENANK